jgi:hypothetical protein
MGDALGSGAGAAARHALLDPARLHLLAETGLIAASAAARLPTLDRVAASPRARARAPSRR